MYELTGKIALVTGAAAGLGQAIAATFAKQGAVVVPTDRPGVSMDQTLVMVREAGAEDIYIHDLDVTCQESIASVVEDVVAKYGRIDILASNAGLNRPMPLEDVTEEVWDSVLNVNLRGGFFVAKAVAAVMKKQNKGRIIFTSSQAGLVARENQQPYCASKGGINAMVRALAFDLAPFGITVNAVAPCFAMTELTRTRLEDPEYRKMVLGMIPVGRCVEPTEVGAAFAYITSEEASMITGQTLVIDGGWTMW
ncbi:MAG: SDR family oxidoreductase [Clostridiales bacterium]|nr:SDR family oxidoreductase [Clostridiales bacterium]